jgi:(2Fe-2S) ferredoxin
MGQYEKHIFVCTFGQWCQRDGDTEALTRELKYEIARAGLKGKVRVNKSGCLNQCGHGPMVVVYPAGHWYAGVAPNDAPEIVAQDILGDRIVTRLSYSAPPGDNKDLTAYPAELVAAEQAAKSD